MITVTIWRTKAGFIHRFRASGHAGYAPAGSDIICSAITAIASTAIGSLEDLAQLDIRTHMEDGLIECCLPDQSVMTKAQCQTAKIILEAMVLGCRQVEQSYGRTYVQVREKVTHKEVHDHDSC